jgi:altronate dehydratase
VIKITANPRTAERMAEHIDLSLVSSLKGRARPEAAGEELWRLMLDVAGGKPTAAEVLGCCELAITRAGPSV